MNDIAWSVALALSSVIMGVASLWALFRPMATGIARKVADDLKQNLKTNEFHDVGVQMEQLDDRIERLDVSINDRMDQQDTRVSARIDQLDTRVNARIDQLDRTVNDRMDRLETRFNDRTDQMEGRLDKRIDQLDARLTGAISEVRTDLGRMHETQGRILEAIRAISPVGNQG